MVKYIEFEFERIFEKKWRLELEKVNRDIGKLKFGVDFDYGFNLIFYVYFMKYFLDNVYCNYLVWYFVYKSGLLLIKINILDIVVGLGIVVYGLVLFL